MERAAAVSSDVAEAYDHGARTLRHCLDVADDLRARGNVPRAAWYLSRAVKDLAPELAVLEAANPEPTKTPLTLMPPPPTRLGLQPRLRKALTHKATPWLVAALVPVILWGLQDNIPALRFTLAPYTFAVACTAKAFGFWPAMLTSLLSSAAEFDLFTHAGEGARVALHSAVLLGTARVIGRS